jgi:hypothetical protein
MQEYIYDMYREESPKRGRTNIPGQKMKKKGEKKPPQKMPPFSLPVYKSKGKV